MDLIVHAEIVGTRTAENGSGGYTVNSTSYSVLTFYSDGSVRLVEGDANQIRPYLIYMHPHIEYKQITSELNQFAVQLRNDMTRLVQDALDKIELQRSNPLPSVNGMRLEDAVSTLKKTGFKTTLSPVAPPHVSGIVVECRRKPDDYMKVELLVRYDMPNVIGLTSDEALKEMRSAGFHATVWRKVNTSAENDHVLRVERDGDGIDVNLIVSDSIEEHCFIVDIESATTVAEIWSYWQKCRMKTEHPDVGTIIQAKLNTENKFGHFTVTQIDAIKAEIRTILIGEKGIIRVKDSIFFI